MGKKVIKDIIQIILSFALGIFIFWFVYKDEDLEQMLTDLRKVNYFWILIPLFLGLISHYIRAIRWKMLINPLEKAPITINVFCAVMVGYFINFLLPRAGEVARCGILKKYENISFSELLGTVIAERAFDLLITLFIIILTVALQFNTISSFLIKIDFNNKLFLLLTNPYLWVFIIIITFLLFICRNKIKTSNFYLKVKDLSSNIMNGLKTFTKVKRKGLFILYSILIFILYYGMLYFSFYGFDFTENLSVSAGLTTYVFGSLGIIAPVQGGIGAWHFMTIEALKIYGINSGQAATFAFLVHAAQSIMLMSVGFFCFMALPFFNKYKKR